MTVHTLKIDEDVFKELLERKIFKFISEDAIYELRSPFGYKAKKRKFNIGDILQLKEIGKNRKWTRYMIVRRITHIFSQKEIDGLHPDYILLCTAGLNDDD